MLPLSHGVPQGAMRMSSDLIPNGLCDLRLATHSTGSKAKAKNSCWGIGHLGRYRIGVGG
jgi:hypothetical protein